MERDDRAAVGSRGGEERRVYDRSKISLIYDKVARLISLDVTAEIRFEYGDENFPPSNYHVENISEIPAELRVQLRLPQTTCKARDRRKSGEACCG